MRPVNLKIQAFGSYAEADIDFTKPNQNIFLVTGDTGAGKTTIFDAMVFALYGEASSMSNKKDGLELQSHYDTEGKTTKVELLFTEKGENYRIVRSPEQIVSKKRGAGTTKRPAKVELFLPDGTLYNGSIKETNSKLTELVGLTKEQFMQVGMIAQGEFMQLLRASTEDRKQIFRKLFNTGIFEDLVRELKYRRDTKEKEIYRISTQIQAECARITLPDFYDDEELNKRIEAIKTGRFSRADVSELYERLILLCEKLQEEEKSAEIEEKKANEALTQLIKTEAEANELIRQYKVLEDAENELSDCRNTEKEIEEKKKLIKSLEGAFEVDNVRKLYQQSKEQLNSTQTRLDDENRKLPAMQKKLAELTQQEKDAEKLYNDAEKNFNLTETEVNEALKLFDEIERVSKELSAEEKKYGEAQKSLAELELQQKKLKEKEEKVKNRLNDLRNAGVEYTKWENHEKEISAIKSDMTELDTAASELKKLRRFFEKALEEYELVSAEYNKKDLEARQAETAFLNAQAGFLAQGLIEGKPCPVCGSIHHPNPCVLDLSSESYSKETVDRLKKERDEFSVERNIKAEASGIAKTNAENAKTVFTEKAAKLKQRMTAFGMTDIPAEYKAVKTYIDSYYESVFEEEKKLKARCDEFEEVGKDAEKIGEELKNIESGINSAKNDESELKAGCARIKSQLETLTAQKKYESSVEAGAILDKSRNFRNTAKSRFDDLRKKKDSVQSTVTTSEANIKTCKDSLPVLSADADRKYRDYELSLSEHGLDEGTLNYLIENYGGKSDKEKFAAEVQNYSDRVLKAEENKKTALNTIRGRVKPDIEKIQSEKDILQIRYDKNRKIYQDAKAMNDNDSSVSDNIRPLIKKHQKTDEEFTRLNALYNRLDGKISGAKMDIETFAQRYYLSKILHSANKRFGTMSAEQYALRLCGEEQAGQGKNHGLDLMVYSNVTGKEREIRTLSGGESFMAALSLALGMADEIQADSGSIHLDVMFIDEGFGSLDDSSRNEAVKVLKQMAGSRRMVGIISHVSELKQEIDDQLIVTKDRNGSKAHWSLS